MSQSLLINSKPHKRQFYGQNEEINLNSLRTQRLERPLILRKNKISNFIGNLRLRKINPTSTENSQPNGMENINLNEGLSKIFESKSEEEIYNSLINFRKSLLRNKFYTVIFINSIIIDAKRKFFRELAEAAFKTSEEFFPLYFRELMGVFQATFTDNINPKLSDYYYELGVIQFLTKILLEKTELLRSDCICSLSGFLNAFIANNPKYQLKIYEEGIIKYFLNIHCPDEEMQISIINAISVCISNFKAFNDSVEESYIINGIQKYMNVYFMDKVNPEALTAYLKIFKVLLINNSKNLKYLNQLLPLLYNKLILLANNQINETQQNDEIMIRILSFFGELALNDKEILSMTLLQANIIPIFYNLLCTNLSRKNKMEILWTISNLEVSQDFSHYDYFFKNEGNAIIKKLLDIFSQENATDILYECSYAICNLVLTQNKDEIEYLLSVGIIEKFFYPLFNREKEFRDNNMINVCLECLYKILTREDIPSEISNLLEKCDFSNILQNFITNSKGLKMIDASTYHQLEKNLELVVKAQNSIRQEFADDDVDML